MFPVAFVICKSSLFYGLANLGKAADSVQNFKT